MNSIRVNNKIYFLFLILCSQSISACFIKDVVCLLTLPCNEQFLKNYISVYMKRNNFAKKKILDKILNKKIDNVDVFLSNNQVDDQIISAAVTARVPRLVHKLLERKNTPMDNCLLAQLIVTEPELLDESMHFNQKNAFNIALERYLKAHSYEYRNKLFALLEQLIIKNRKLLTVCTEGNTPINRLTVHQTRLAILFASHGADPLESKSRRNVLQDVLKKREGESEFVNWVSENTCFAYHVVTARALFLKKQQQHIKKKLPIWLYSIGRKGNKGKFLPKDMINTIISFYEKSENFTSRSLNRLHKRLIKDYPTPKLRKIRYHTDDWKDDDKINYENKIERMDKAESYRAFG